MSSSGSCVPPDRGDPSALGEARHAGACADRLGFAFTGGYSEALRVLVPGLPPSTLTGLCATGEAGRTRGRSTRASPRPRRAATR